MNPQKLESTARALVAKGKGILAADESLPTIKKRFTSIDLDSTEDSRCSYRELLFATPGIEAFISGVILFEETFYQNTKKGIPIPDLLTQKHIMPGIKVDKSTHMLAGFPGEKITEGLDGLRDRLGQYSAQGAQFAKWRAVITIGKGIPTHCCIKANAHALARYAALCQEVDLVPIVEPEVLMDGDHDIDRCEAVSTATLKSVFAELQEHQVVIEGMLLKASMVLAGKQSPKQASVAEVAETTLRCLRRTVPAAVPGIVFLSGGQSPELATEHLNAMNTLNNHPWPLSFSFGRALQEPALKTWKGDPANLAAAQEKLYYRAKCNSMACCGSLQTEKEVTVECS